MSWAKSWAVKLREKHQQRKPLHLERQSFWWWLYILEVISPVSSLICFLIYLTFLSVSCIPRCTHAHTHTEPRAHSVSYVLWGLALVDCPSLHRSTYIIQLRALSFCQLHQCNAGISRGENALDGLTLDVGCSEFQWSWWEWRVLQLSADGCITAWCKVVPEFAPHPPPEDLLEQCYRQVSDKLGWSWSPLQH